MQTYEQVRVVEGLMEDPSKLENRVLTVNGRPLVLLQHLRKRYQVQVFRDGVFNDEPGIYEFSDAAKEVARTFLDAGIDAQVRVVEVTRIPKVSFTKLWKEFKDEFKSQGVYLTK